MPPAPALQSVIEPTPQPLPEAGLSISAAVQPESTPPAPSSPEALFEVLVENAPVAMAMFDRELRYLVANRQWIADFGLQHELSLVGHSQFEVFPNLHPAWRSVYDRALKGHIVRSENDITVGPDGEPVIFRWEVRPWRRKADAAVSGVMVTCEKFAPIGLPDAAPATPSATDATPANPSLPACNVPTLLLDAGGIVLHANPAAHRLFLSVGISEGQTPVWEVLGRGQAAAELHRDTLLAITAALQGNGLSRAFPQFQGLGSANGKPLQWAMSRSGSREGEARVLLIGFPPGDPALASSEPSPPAPSLPSAADQAASSKEKRRLEAELATANHELTLYRDLELTFRRREQRQREVLDAMPCGLIVLDERGRPIFHNAHVRDLFGRELKPGDAVEDWLMQACLNDSHRDEVARIWRESVWRRQLTKVVSLSTADGLLKDFEFRPAPLPNHGLLLSIYDVTDTCRLEEMLRSTEAKFRTLLHESPSAALLTDSLGGIFEVNPAAEQLLKHYKQELRRTGIDAWLTTAGAEWRKQECQRLAQGQAPAPAFPIELQLGENPTVQPALLKMAGIYDGEGKLHALAHFLTLPATPAPVPQPEEKPPLATPPNSQMEAERRFKNQLQLIASLLNLQSNELEDEQAQAAFRSVLHRVRTISALNEQLLNAPTGKSGALEALVESLIRHLREGFDMPESRVQVILDLKQARVREEAAMPLALILNEALSNSFKHAFPQNRSGKIEVALTTEGEDAQLSVRDNGVGLQAGSVSNQGLGCKVIKVFAEQLGSYCSMENTENGEMCFNLQFPIKYLII